MEAEQIRAVRKSQRWVRCSPESLARSRVPVSWSITPTIMNSGALNREWASSMASPAMAASRLPRPLASSRKPSWETVP